MIELERNDSPISGGGGLWNSVFGGDDAVSLRSRAFLSILFLLSEGEIDAIQGDIRRSIYINETAIIDEDGTENFKGVLATVRTGTQFQSAISGVSQGAAAPTNVGVLVKNSSPAIVRTINAPLAGKIKITLFTDGLSRTDDQGFVKTSQADFKISLSTNGSPFVLKVEDSFKGRTAGGYARDYTIDVSTAGPWRIKVQRTNSDVAISDTKEQNNLFWQSYTPIVEQLFKYPNSALLFLKFDSAFFKTQPIITIRLRGIICRVPSNYNANTRTYTGLWDGTFVRSWTNNPAWCLLELLTNKRFGVGNYISLDAVDKWSLYRISQYCDELVNDGFGGLEPRFTYNNYLNTKVDAFATIQGILGQIRGLAYYANGQILFSQDRPDIEPVDIYTLANTVCQYDDEGVLTQPNFTYDYVSLKEKHSKCHVSWYDPNDQGKRKIAYIDLFDIGYGRDFQRYGDEVKEVDLPGCVSEAEARRHGRWILLTERLESKTVTFATGEQGLIRLPGDLIKISDPYEVGGRSAGRIMLSTLTSVSIDDPIVVDQNFNLSCVINGQVQMRPIVNPIGTTSVLNVFPAFTASPSPGSIWMVSGNASPETYRILSISNPDLGKYGIVAIKHAGKYAAIDSLETLTPISTNPKTPAAPFSMNPVSIPTGYFVGWTPSISQGVTGYNLEYESQESGYWTPVAINPGVADTEIVLPQAAYNFRVRAYNIFGKTSKWTYSGLISTNSGIAILVWNEDGSVKLNNKVTLEPGKTYFLNTLCAEPAGNSLISLPNPYIDRRKIITAPGTTDTIEVSPSYLGDRRELTSGSYPNLEMWNKVTWIKLDTGLATAYSGVNYTGVASAIVPGTYWSPLGNLPPKSVVVNGGTLTINQWRPGDNPIPSSNWKLTTTPLEAITADGLAISVSTSTGAPDITL